MPKVLLGRDLRLYLGGHGELIISGIDRPDLTLLGGATDFQLDAPLEGAVIANVGMLISEAEFPIPLDQCRFVVDGQECGSEVIREAQQIVRARNAVREQAAGEHPLTRFLTLPEMARHLGLEPIVLLTLAESGNIPCMNTGGEGPIFNRSLTAAAYADLKAAADRAKSTEKPAPDIVPEA